MFDNSNAPWQSTFSAEIPTVGDRLRELGYYTSYHGKFHLSKEFDKVKVDEVPDANLTRLNELMNAYGFADYFGVGDIIGGVLGGYRFDEFITSTAIRWLRGKAQRINAGSKPWFAAVNLVNPHDVMHYDTDQPGESVQKTPKPMMPINRDPGNAIYARQWNPKLPKSRKETWDKPGRPDAHKEFQSARQALVGDFPNEDARWKRLLNYYLNCMSDCDTHVERLLDELDDLGLTDNTIVVMSADHGELGGAHGMHGKGASAYREQNHVPLVIRHPSKDVPRGATCGAVTSHVDLTPTILSLASNGVHKPGSDIVGKDLSALLRNPQAAKADAVRDGALYCFNMWLYLDAAYMQAIAEILNSGKDPKTEIKARGLKLDMTHRGAIRSVFDGRYKFSRYFSPKQHNVPTNLEELFKLNDVELFDTENDPHEMDNMAADRRAARDLLEMMNEKLNKLIESEVGKDEGQMLPGEQTWVVDANSLDP